MVVSFLLPVMDDLESVSKKLMNTFPILLVPNLIFGLTQTNRTRGKNVTQRLDYVTLRPFVCTKFRIKSPFSFPATSATISLRYYNEIIKLHVAKTLTSKTKERSFHTQTQWTFYISNAITKESMIIILLKSSSSIYNVGVSTVRSESNILPSVVH